MIARPFDSYIKFNYLLSIKVRNLGVLIFYLSKINFYRSLKFNAQYRQDMMANTLQRTALKRPQVEELICERFPEES